jgi:Na+-translocating ferredoxin:NAD+ oxidoreductase subunit C
LGFFKSRSFSGGVHPPDCKQLTREKKIEKCPAPSVVVIPVQQHIGAPSKPVVGTGTRVCIGDPLTEPSGFVSVPVHASVSGTITAIENHPHPTGSAVLSFVIQNDGQEEWNKGIAFDKDYLNLGVKDMLGRIQQAGLSGMGGATFPTHVKLSPPADIKIHTFLLNGAECEPFLTSDHRLMVEETGRILLGMQIMIKILGARIGAIGIESNKTDAVQAIKKRISELKLPYKVITLPVKYPQGAEKQLIYALTGRKVPAGRLPMEIGCIVQNVATAAAVYDAVAFKKPLIERIVTVSGNGIQTPKNLLVRIGTRYSDVFSFCDGLKKEAGKIIMGGPMMGLAQASSDIPVIKGTSGLVILDEKQSRRREEQRCISCARCVDTCPMSLLPSILATLVKAGRFDALPKNNILDCIECGSCAYVCPAHINLVHFIKFGKNQIMKGIKKAS